jgi:hypothetical protein
MDSRLFDIKGEPGDISLWPGLHHRKTGFGVKSVHLKAWQVILQHGDKKNITFLSIVFVSPDIV